MKIPLHLDGLSKRDLIRHNLVLESTGKEKPVKVIKGSRVGEIKVFSHIFDVFRKLTRPLV